MSVPVQLDGYPVAFAAGLVSASAIAAWLVSYVAKATTFPTIICIR